MQSKLVYVLLALVLAAAGGPPWAWLVLGSAVAISLALDTRAQLLSTRA